MFLMLDTPGGVVVMQPNTVAWKLPVRTYLLRQSPSSEKEAYNMTDINNNSLVEAR